MHESPIVGQLATYRIYLNFLLKSFLSFVHIMFIQKLDTEQILRRFLANLDSNGYGFSNSLQYGNIYYSRT